MLTKNKAFTLIELLIAIAILSILAAISIPHILSAIHRGKQKGTMGHIHILALHLADYIVDHQSFEGVERSFSELSDGDLGFLVPFYCLSYPIQDKWGNKFRVALGKNNGRGYEPGAENEYIIESRGRDGKEDSWNYDNQITSGNGDEFDFYEINSIYDFNNDIILINGDFVHAPISAVGKTD